MNRNTKLYAVLGLSAVIYLVIVLAVPFHKGSVFAISLAFELIAFALQIPFFKVAFEKRDSIKSKFLGLPVFRVGITYLCVESVVSLLLIIIASEISSLPIWVAVVLNVIILCVGLICGISVDIARDTVEVVENTNAVKTDFMKNLRARAENLVAMGGEYRVDLKKLAENIRFSDPVSSESTATAEASLDDAIKQLESALSSGNGDVKSLIGNAQTALNLRNDLTKSGKRN